MFKKNAPVVKSDIDTKVVLLKRGIQIHILMFIALVGFAVSGAAGSWYFYQKYHVLKSDPNIEAQKVTEALVASLGKLIELPQGELPTVATISDKEKLANQAFFKAAENGDILFAYTTDMRAILYRPTTNKIINVAPITMNQPLQNPSQNNSISSTPRIAYYNGTDIVGLSGVTEKTVKEKYPNLETVVLANATRKDYTKTLVVDLSGKRVQEAANLALLVKGIVGSLPQGEAIPAADILIISGR